MKDKRKIAFNKLVSEAKNCNLCPRMCNRKKVLSDKNGNINSKVIFIAEAPGRLGAERTGIPLCGDQTGNNFEELLKSIGWEREKVFITNALLCNPQDEEGKNDPPNMEEIKNCSDYLKKTIELVNPDVIVTLGGIALNAFKYISNHSFVLRDSVAKEQEWNGKKLFPLYHPGDRAKRYRKENQQMADFAALKRIVDHVAEIL